MAIRKNINTFNPRSGVSIPAWATDSFKGTVDSLENIADDVTSSIRESKKDEMAFIQEQSRIAQRKEEFEYKKGRDEYRDASDYLDILLSGNDGSPDSTEESQASIRAMTGSSNPLVTALKDTAYKNLDSRKQQYENSKDNILGMFFGGQKAEDLTALDNIRLNDYIKQNASNPEWAKELIKSNIEKDFGGKLAPDFFIKGRAQGYFSQLNEYSKMMIGMKKGTKQYKLLEDGYNEADAKLRELAGPNTSESEYTFDQETINLYSQISGDKPDEIISDLKNGTLNEEDMLSSITNVNIEDEEEGFIDQIKEFASGLFSSSESESSGGIAKNVEWRGKEVIVAPGSEMIDEAGNKSYIVENEDGGQDRVSYAAIKDQLPEDFGKADEPSIFSQINSMKFPDDIKDESITEKLKYLNTFLGNKAVEGFANIGKSAKSAVSGAGDGIKEFENEYKLLENAPGTYVGQFVDYVGEIYDEVEDDSNPNLSSVGKEVIQIGKTLGRFFPQIAEDIELYRSGKSDKYMDLEGVRAVDALKQTRDDIRKKQGGVYYAKSGKYITKRNLIGKGNVMLPSEDFDSELARLPNKMINPRYIEDKVIDLAASMTKNISTISKIYTAGPRLKKFKNNLSKNEKELRKLKQDIKEAEKYRAPGVYRITSGQIDDALETIKIAKSKRVSMVKNPFPVVNEAERARVAKKDALNTQSATSEMRDAEKILRDLLTEQTLSNSGMFQSANPNNPFGR